MTELFYKYLSEGIPVDIALQKAKLEFIIASRGNRLPYYWAATIVAGKTEVLVENKKNTWIYIGIIAAFAAGISFFGWRKWNAGN